MEFGIQVGYGLQTASLLLTQAWKGGICILSPRAFRTPKSGSLEKQIVSFSQKLKSRSASPLFDPIMYTEMNPRPQLDALSYFRVSEGELDLNYKQVIKSLSQLNKECETVATILPSHTLGLYNSSWDDLQKEKVACASEYRRQDEIIPTIALSVEAVKDSRSIESVAEAASGWGVSKVYVVCEHPNNDYLVDDAHWLTNVIRLVSWLKLSGLTVYFGYASHQMLVLSLAKCDAIFAGGYLNMRRFHTDDFHKPDSPEPSRRAIWYYCPQVLSEYKLVTLDIAYEKSVLSQLNTPLDPVYSNMLFSAGTLPSNTSYKESDSFLHYLQCLRMQCSQIPDSNYGKVLAYLESSFNVAEENIQGLRETGIFDRNRSFADALSAGEQATAAFNDEMGFNISQLWGGIQ